MSLKNNYSMETNGFDLSKYDNPKKGCMLTALAKCFGNVTEAAQAIGISRETHYRWIKEDEAYKKDVYQIGEMSKDFVESKLFQVINGYTLPEDVSFLSRDRRTGANQIVTQKGEKHIGPDTQAIKFYLSTRAKDRGYENATAITGKGGGPIQMQQMKDVSIELSRLPVELLDQILQHLNNADTEEPEQA